MISRRDFLKLAALGIGAPAFRPLTTEEVSPISLDVQDKRIVVKVFEQILACYEGTRGTVGIAADTTGAIWIADTGNNRLLRFHPWK